MAVVVRIEMWPGGDPEKKYDLGHVVIVNVGGDNASGDYAVGLFEGEPKQGKKVGAGKVTGHARRLGYFKLLARALAAAMKDGAGELPALGAGVE